MFASVTVAQVDPARIGELHGLYERLLPQLEATTGWRGIYLVVDGATGNGHLLGLWDTEEDAVAFEASGAFGRILADYPPGLLLGPPQRSTGEVVFHALHGDK